MRETVAALRPILAGERSAFRGHHVASQGFRLAAGATPSRLAVAAFGDRMIQLAARVADRAVVNLLTPAQVARVRARLDAAAHAAGVAAPSLVAWVPGALEPTAATEQQLARQLVAYLAAPGYGEMFVEAGFGELVARARGGAHPRELMNAVRPELIAAVGAVGSQSEVRARLQAYHSAGADVVGVVPVSRGLRDLLRIVRDG
jgi:probable F420-dependent oxidoreductase